METILSKFKNELKEEIIDKIDEKNEMIKEQLNEHNKKIDFYSST